MSVLVLSSRLVTATAITTMPRFPTGVHHFAEHGWHHQRLASFSFWRSQHLPHQRCQQFLRVKIRRTRATTPTSRMWSLRPVTSTATLSATTVSRIPTGDHLLSPDAFMYYNYTSFYVMEDGSMITYAVEYSYGYIFNFIIHPYIIFV